MQIYEQVWLKHFYNKKTAYKLSEENGNNGFYFQWGVIRKYYMNK
jgi:hypothetical protein